VIKLSTKICDSNNWNLHQVRFYTGVPKKEDDQRWYDFWTKKLSRLGRQGVKIYSRQLRYSEKTFTIPNYGEYTARVGREKGIDLRIAFDSIRLFREDKADVIIFFSQDQDFTEAVKDLRNIAQEKDKWIEIACAYLVSPYVTECRGIQKTKWIKIIKELYDSCIDPTDYRTFSP